MPVKLLIALAVMFLAGAAPAAAQEIPPSEETEEPPPPKLSIAKAPTKKPAAPTEAAGKKLQDDVQPDYNTVVLQGLNKVTGHISRLDGPLGAVQRFGNLEIIARRCWKAPPEERPENAALLEIRELQLGEEPKRVFLGWMFSSSPGLSGLGHAVYDITMLSCEYRADHEKKERPEDKKSDKKMDKKSDKKEPSVRKESKTVKKTSDGKGNPPPKP